MTTPIYQRIAQDLSDKINAGVWPVGHKLPSIRSLSQEYQAAKITIQNALHKLEARGVIHAKAKSGFYVCPPRRTEPQKPAFVVNTPAVVEVPALFHDIMARSAAFDLYPKASLPPAKQSLVQLQRCISRAMRKHGHSQAVYYCAPEGSDGLRQQLRYHYQTMGMGLNADELCITAGCQNSLLLALMSTCQPGDTVAVEQPAFYGVLQLLQQLQLQVVEIPVSPTQGITTEDLAEVAKHWNIKACVVTANFATPTGALMPDCEKRALVALATKLDIALIEDDIYGDLGFHGRPKPLKAFDKQGQVLLCSSFSKSLSRDLRIGWIAGGKWHQQIVRLKLITQLANSQSLQEGLADYMAEGFFRRHLQSYRQQLLHQRDELVELLRQHWDFAFTYTVPEGGLAMWAALPAQVNTTALYQQLITRDIVLTPGALFTSQAQFCNYLRLSFAHPYRGARQRALLELGVAISSQLR